MPTDIVPGRRLPDAPIPTAKACRSTARSKFASWRPLSLGTRDDRGDFEAVASTGANLESLWLLNTIIAAKVDCEFQ
jgi:hypothetical protein